MKRTTYLKVEWDDQYDASSDAWLVERVEGIFTNPGATPIEHSVEPVTLQQVGELIPNTVNPSSAWDYDFFAGQGSGVDGTRPVYVVKPSTAEPTPTGYWLATVLAVAMSTYSDEDFPLSGDERSPEALACLAELRAVLERRGFSLGHQDEYHGFLIQRGDRVLADSLYGGQVTWRDWLDGALEVRARGPGSTPPMRPRDLVPTPRALAERTGRTPRGRAHRHRRGYDPVQ